MSRKDDIRLSGDADVEDAKRLNERKARWDTLSRQERSKIGALARKTDVAREAAERERSEREIKREAERGGRDREPRLPP